MLGRSCPGEEGEEVRSIGHQGEPALGGAFHLGINSFVIFPDDGRAVPGLVRDEFDVAGERCAVGDETFSEGILFGALDLGFGP